MPKERVVMVQKLLESGKRKARAPEGEAAAGGARHQLEDCEGDRADDSRELLFRADKVIE